MSGYTRFLKDLIEQLTKLPTIGPRSAERMALYLLRASKPQVQDLARAIVEAREKTTKCRICNGLSEDSLCPICQEKDRREKKICVVEGPQDVLAIERSGKYRGLYHVLWGTLSPLEGTGPEDLPIKQLQFRLRAEKIEEIIIATGSSREGENTAVYLKKLVAPLGIKVTCLARGIPMGSSIGYIDPATISEALEGRR